MENTTRKTTLVKQWKRYASPWRKGLGLMFRLRAPEYAVVFPFRTPERVAIHMWFVFFSLDVVWLDECGVVQEAQTLHPWSFYRPRVKSTWVLELPAGTLARTGTKKKDKISIQELKK